MTRIKHISKGIIIFVILSYSFLPYNVCAHEGYEHVHNIISLDRSTIVHLQSVLFAYQDIYRQLTDGNLKGIDEFAQRMADAALLGSRTEPNKSAGRHMMLHVLQGAGVLKKSENLREAQNAFFSICETIVPFFESWPNQLKKFRLKLYRCEDNKYQWLQAQNLPPVYPYSPGCKDIKEVVR